LLGCWGFEVGMSEIQTIEHWEVWPTLLPRRIQFCACVSKKSYLVFTKFYRFIIFKNKNDSFIFLIFEFWDAIY
jgi:hypothetical protein